MSWLRSFLLFEVITAGGAIHAAPQALSEAQARHLLARTGFAPGQSEVELSKRLSAQTAVDLLVSRAQSS